MLKLASNKIGTFLTSLWRHARHLFTVFRWIFCRYFSLSTTKNLAAS